MSEHREKIENKLLLLNNGATLALGGLNPKAPEAGISTAQIKNYVRSARKLLDEIESVCFDYEQTKASKKAEPKEEKRCMRYDENTDRLDWGEV